jgi:hypothetical protein
MKTFWLALVPFQLLLILTKPTVAQATTQSIASDTAWQAMDPCARACFQTWVAGCWAPALDGILGCDSNYCLYASNDCYCRADHQPVAVSYLSSCVSKSCTVGDAQIDVNSAVTVYDGYCSSNGYLPTAPATTSAQTTPGPTVTTTVYVTKPSSGVSLRFMFVGWDMILTVLSTPFNGIFVQVFSLLRLWLFDFMQVKKVEANLFVCLIRPAVSYSSTPSPTSGNKASSVTPVVNDPLPTSRTSTSTTATQISSEPTTTDASSGSSSSPGSSGAGLSVGDKASVASAIIGGIALILAYFTMPRRYRECLCCCFGGSRGVGGSSNPESYDIGYSPSNHPHTTNGANHGVVNGGMTNVINNFNNFFHR